MMDIIRKADGTFAKNEWITTSDGKTYYFDGIYKVRGIQTIDGKEYLLTKMVHISAKKAS